MNAVHTLRKSGVKVNITHYRVVDTGVKNSRKKVLPMHVIREKGWQPFIQAKGGKTEVTLSYDNFSVTASAECSRKDAYIRKYGLKVGMERALATINPLLANIPSINEEINLLINTLSHSSESKTV